MIELRALNRKLIFASACVVLLINSAVLFSSLNSLIDTTSRVRQSIDVKGELTRVVVEMVNAESSQRGYLLTADLRFLDPYYSASSVIHSRLESLGALVSDDPEQARQVKQISDLVTRKFADMAEKIKLRSSGRADAATELVRQNRGREIALEFHRAVASMQKREEELLRERQSEAALAKQAAFLTLGGFVTTTALLLAALFYLARREITRKALASQEHEAMAIKLQEQAEHLTRERNDVSLLNEASNFLQSCDSMGEISVVLGPFLERLFPNNSGAIHITAASRNRLDLVDSWGDKPVPRQFAPDECWALRRGQIHARGEKGVSPCCEHFPSDFEARETLCIPLVAQGETLGLLSLVNEMPVADAAVSKDTGRLAEMVARQIGLTLSNIKLRESLRDQSIRDPMTKAFNRRHLETVVEKELAKAIRYERPLSIAMVDIDHFKRYNDAHGHQAGDAALIAVTQHIQSSLRESDWLFRYGGEEFLILFSESGLQNAAARLDEIRDAVARLGIAIDGVSLPHVTISCGIAALDDNMRTLEALVSAADGALYEAKNAGRNQVRRAADRAVTSSIA
jgi:diguanylate cyclase (GGDEF)-like protein